MNLYLTPLRVMGQEFVYAVRLILAFSKTEAEIMDDPVGIVTVKCYGLIVFLYFSGELSQGCGSSA